MTPSKWGHLKRGEYLAKRNPLSVAVNIALSNPDYDAVEIEMALSKLHAEEMEAHLASLR